MRINIRESFSGPPAFILAQWFLYPLLFFVEIYLPIVPFSHFLKSPYLSTPCLSPARPGPSPTGPGRPPCLACPSGARPQRSRHTPFCGFCARGWVVSFPPWPSPPPPWYFLPPPPAPRQWRPSSLAAHSRTPAPAARAPRAPLPAEAAAAREAPSPLPSAPSPARLAAAGAGPRAAPCYSRYCV